MLAVCTATLSASGISKSIEENKKSISFSAFTVLVYLFYTMEKNYTFS